MADNMAEPQRLGLQQLREQKTVLMGFAMASSACRSDCEVLADCMMLLCNT